MVKQFSEEKTLSGFNDNFIDKIEIILRVDNLQKYYGYIKAVDELTFHVRKGEIYGLLGPNGAGKTTTIKSILGLLNIRGGEISVFNFNPINSPEKVKEKIGYVSEEPLLFESLTVRELFNFIASIRKLDPTKTGFLVQEYLESLDALKYYNRIIGTLSHGNRQKIQIISALIHRPPLLVLDEPLSGIDARSAAVIKNLLQIHIKNGGAILLSTHIMEQAQYLCDRIGIINQGKLVAEGTFEELKSQVTSATGASLEEIFLELTHQNESVTEVIDKLQRNIDYYSD